MDFELQVSSAGLDRPLKHEKQFKKSIGKKVSILLVSGLEVEGTLSHCDEKVLHLAKEIVSPKDKSKKVKGIENIALEREQIKEVKRLVTFK
jgi:ribosome maturation factor RimP